MEGFSVLGSTTKRLTKRKPVQGGTRQRTEVTPAVTLTPGQTVYGCPVNIFESTQADLDIKVTKREKELMMSQARQKIKDLPSLEIQRVSFSLFSHEELQQQAVFKVTKTDDEGLHTVNDPRSGVVDDDKLCRTCLKDNLECPGHYGIIELNQHIIHPMFRREVVDVLTSICNSCGSLLLTRDQIIEKGIINQSGSKRLRAIADASKNLPCRKSQENIAAGVAGCIPNPVYKASKVKEVGKIFYTYDGKKGSDENEKSVEEVEQILNAISEEDAALLGFSGKSHPRRFITKSLPIVPICARAPVVQDGMVLKDDITLMYQDIVKYNQELLKENVKRNEKEREDIVKGLIFSIEHLIDNSDATYRPGKMKMKSYRDIKSRVQGKEAIIRNLIQGKRVNFSARTVLGPDPNLKFGQIGIPRVWAAYLTHPEIVSPANVGRLTALFKAGQVTHITLADGKLEGRRIRVTDKVKNAHQLRAGDIVERWLQTGDNFTPSNFVAFNRQPTLHKQSIMGYEVVLRDAMTIGLHLSYTTPHNAD